MTHPSLRTAMTLALAAILAPHLFAQTGSTPSQSNPSSVGANGSITQGKDTSPLNSMNTMNMAAPREASAFKTFQQIPDSDFDKKVKAGEEFLKKYNTSALLPAVYGTLAVTYIQNGQPQKGYAAGEKALQLEPNDMRTLANLAQSMARLATPNDPNAAQDLQKAEDYAQRCIQTTPKLRKPDGASDEEYNNYNTQNLAMAHAALGTVYIRQGKLDEAIPELQQSVKLAGAKDATNLYLLGVASENSSHYPEALEAFNKCLANPGNLQKACSDGAAAAKQHVK